MHARNPATEMSPPVSPSSGPTSDPEISEGARTPLSLDLSAIPPLVTPHPPSNTLLITNLNSAHTFHPATLSKIKDLLSTPIPLNSFSPLRSLHRIIVSYPTPEAAISMRQALENQPFGSDSDRARIYFGEPTPLAGEMTADQHLKAPSLGKLLFISPPPSPPCGWEIREEEPPNKDVHAGDLQRALAGLGAGAGRRGSEGEGSEVGGMSEEEIEELGLGLGGADGRGREGSASLCVYHPRVHGDREDLPKVMVVDTTADGDGEGEMESPLGGRRSDMTKTARPPVELMEG